MPPRAGRVGQKRVALDGRIDRGSTPPHHPRHRRYRHAYSDRYQHKDWDDSEKSGRRYVPHMLIFPVQRGTCRVLPVPCRAVKKRKVGQHAVKVQHDDCG